MIAMRQGTPDDWAREMSIYRDMGLTHVSAVTMNAGFASPAAHIEAIERFKDAAAEFQG